MQTNRQQLGEKGEQLAAEYLTSNGMRIVDRNWRFNHGELDIIAIDESDLVVVEVKSVRVQAFGSGEERISPAQQKKVIETTFAFLDQHPQYENMGVRFDVVVVNFFKYPAEIRHYPGAFWQT